MSDYDKRYSAQFDFISTYKDTPEEVLALVDFYGQKPDWISEGYGEHREVDYDRTMVTRRTTRKVLLSEIEFLVQRNLVQRLIEGGN